MLLTEHLSVCFNTFVQLGQGRQHSWPALNTTLSMTAQGIGARSFLILLPENMSMLDSFCNKLYVTCKTLMKP
jgi:hypothetical protein